MGSIDQIPEDAEGLIVELEKILEMTTHDVVDLYFSGSQEREALVDTYRSIVDLARRELQSEYEYLFHLLGEVGAPVQFVVDAFMEQNSSRLFQAAKTQFEMLLGLPLSESIGEHYVPADQLLKVLESVMRPPWWKPGYGTHFELSANLASMVRLAGPVRNAIAWAIDNGHQGDEQKQKEIRGRVSLLLTKHGWYKHTFAAEVRRRILYKETNIQDIAALIFDSSEYKGARPVQTIAAATRLQSPAREGALAILRSTLAVGILCASGFGERRVLEIYRKLQPLMQYVVGTIFSKEKSQQLKSWMTKAESVHYPAKDLEGQIGDLLKRLNDLESVLSRGNEEKRSERQDRVRALSKNVLEVLREELTDPLLRWGGETYAMMANYCELLWEDAMDETFRGHTDPHAYNESECLEMRRLLTELDLGFRKDGRGRGWWI